MTMYDSLRPACCLSDFIVEFATDDQLMNRSFYKVIHLTCGLESGALMGCGRSNIVELEGVVHVVMVVWKY